MRRPSPLPIPASRRSDPDRNAPRRGTDAASSRPDAASERRDAASSRPDAAPPADAAFDAQDTAPLTPLLPTGAADRGARDRQADPADDRLRPDTMDAGAPEHAAAEIRPREVWAAARARRRALRAEVRRFTGRQRRRRLTLLGVAASLVVLVAGTAGAAYSPLFAVEQISVVGGSRLDAAAVEQSLDEHLGTPLPLVDESAVKAALVGFPLIESYSLEARPPHDLVVRVIERTPIGYLESAAGFSLVDAAGVVLATTPEPGTDAPVVTARGGADGAAFEAIGHVMRSLPADIRSQVTAAAATTADDVRLTLGGANSAVVWGSAERSADKAAALAAIMISHPPGAVSEYDVSSPTAVVVR